VKPISDLEAILLHRILAEYHQRLARESKVALKHEHHDKIAMQLESEASFIEDFLQFRNETE
jgi:hypothetical protein